VFGIDIGLQIFFEFLAREGTGTRWPGGPGPVDSAVLWPERHGMIQPRAMKRLFLIRRALGRRLEYQTRSAFIACDWHSFFKRPYPVNFVNFDGKLRAESRRPDQGPARSIQLDILKKCETSHHL